MLALIWSKEKNIKEEIAKTYWTLFLNDREFSNKQISENLVKLMNNLTLTEATSLEELISFILDHTQSDDKKKFSLTLNIHKEIWNIFILSFKNITNIDDKVFMRSALQILRILVVKNSEILFNRLDSFMSVLEFFLRFKVNLKEKKKKRFYFLNLKKN